MPFTTSNSPSIYYETTGDPGGEPVLLIEGWGAQLLGWREGFVERLTAHGLFVIRLDNRDVGLSAKLGEPDELEADYAIQDMAQDVCQVLDALGLASAHIVGQSMGGIIAQTLAIEHAARVRSLVLFYTIPAYDPAYVTEDVRQALEDRTLPPPLTREEAIAAKVSAERSICGSTEYAFDEAWMRELATRSYDRCFRPDGGARQASAVRRSGDRRARLSQISAPTAIIHGRADRALKAEASLELGRLIPESEVHIYPGMGHQVVEPLWDEFVATILRTVARTR